MCGITGFLGSLDKHKSVSVLEKMLTRLRHRGPDESGVYVSDQIALGSVRLSIQDIKSGGMPISNVKENLWIVFNGEIFNFIELRQELIQKGHIFKTTGDTEVVVHLYEEYGPSFLQKLIGQFAIAIWDKKNQELFLARDRVGIRPLYYTEKNGTFLFASEMKAFLEYPDFNFTISQEALAQYFTFWTALSPNTIFNGIYEVPPGAYIIINQRGKQINQYWELPILETSQQKIESLELALEQFDELFTDAVRLRLRADVPVAAYLSGGLDSTITTSYIQKIAGDNLQTFSVGFSDKDFDESGYQNLAASYFNTKHSSIIISEEEMQQNLQNVVWHCEAPLLRTSPSPMYALAKNVRENNIKVVITGEGADEILGGYNIFKETKIRHFWARDVNSKYRPLLLKKLYPYIPMIKGANSTALKLFFGYQLSETKSPIYSHLIRWNNTARIKNYFSKEYKSNTNSYDPIVDYLNKIGNKLDQSDYLSKASYIEMDLFLSGYLLSSQGDRMAMANSVEGRYPFLDHRVIEFCMALKSDYKLNGLNEKYFLKKLMKGKIPIAILDRPKQAYRAPIRNTIISDKKPGFVDEMFSDKNLNNYGIFDTKNVNQLIRKMELNKQISEIDNMALIGILSTQILHELFVERKIKKLIKADILKLDKIIID